MPQLMLFETPVLGAPEESVLARVSALKKSIQYSLSNPKRWSGIFRQIALAKAIRGSNSIEGYNVSMDDALAAVGGEEPAEASSEAWTAVIGYRMAMTYVLGLASDPHFLYSVDLLRSLHFMMIQHDLSKNPGKWRPGVIFVRNDETGQIVYEGPDAEQVPPLMAELMCWLNSSDTASTPGMVKAAMGHLNLVMIHPFSDGNGRMARCLQTLILARTGVISPEFSSIEEYLGRGSNALAYYNVLAQVGAGSWHPERNALAWVRFCLTAHFVQATTVTRRLKEMDRLWNELEICANRRKLPDRSLFALVDAALGYRVRNARYRVDAEVSDQIASRDLKLLVNSGLLEPRGERRGRSYVASDELRGMRTKIRDRSPIHDPFIEDERRDVSTETTGSSPQLLPGMEGLRRP